MRKTINYIDAGCLTYLLSLLTVSLLFGLSQDILFFKTDPAALVHFLLAAGCLLAIVLAVPVVTAVYFSNAALKERGLRLFSILAFSLILFGFLIHFLESSEVFRFTLRQIDANWTQAGETGVYGIVVSGSLLVCLLLACFFSRVTDIHPRVVSLSYGVTALGIALLLLIPVVSSFSGSSLKAREARRNAVLIVLDGLSTKYLSPYNPDANTPEFAALAEASVLYTNVRTNFTHTSGFFYALHAGQKKSWSNAQEKKQTGLLQQLQQAGVNTRWFTYHNNGVPDVHNFPYRGLRSTYLVSRFSWLPRVMQVDYNVFEMRGAGGRGRAMGAREKAIHGWMSRFHGDSYLNPLQGWVMDEIRSLREDTRPFFMIVHLPVSALTAAKDAPKTWELEEAGFMPTERLQKVRQKMLKDQDYTYLKEDAWAVDVLREKYRQSIRQGSQSLKAFMQEFAEQGWQEDTLVMVTADHGKILSKGKIEYGYHNDEEVTRVPLLVQWKGQKGIDSRLGESVDLPQTFLEFFDIEQKLSPEAVSLLGEDKKTRATSLTTWSHKRKEWFLNVYEGEHRYVFNLYPGNTSMRKEKIQSPYKTVRVGEGKKALAGAGFDLKEILASYGIQGNPETAESVWSLLAQE